MLAAAIIKQCLLSLRLLPAGHASPVPQIPFNIQNLHVFGKHMLEGRMVSKQFGIKGAGHNGGL
jgi:hypothetical protein